MLEQGVDADAAPAHVELGPLRHAADVDRPVAAREGLELVPVQRDRLADEALDRERPAVERRARRRPGRQDREVASSGTGPAGSGWPHPPAAVGDQRNPASRTGRPRSHYTAAAIRLLGGTLVPAEGPRGDRDAHRRQHEQAGEPGQHDRQSGLAMSASRPASTAQLTGLKRATVCDPSGRQRERHERRRQERQRQHQEGVAPITDSRWRSSRASAFEMAPKAAASSASAKHQDREADRPRP